MTKVLIADDQPSVRQMLSDLLLSSGYEVIVAENGRQAADLASSEKPNLIIMDLMMPVMNGVDAAAEIKSSEELQDIKIIFLTARGQPQDEARAREAGADGFVAKPFSPRNLAKQIAETLAQ